MFGIGHNVTLLISGTGLHQNSDMQLNPKMIKALATSHVIQITCGYNHSLALTQSECYEF
jgi:alpha-tubulin suppressor-like RCC1 family protein